MNSMYPVSYRFSSGRHTDAFYMYYESPILCRLTDLNYSAVNKEGLVERDCPITFTVRCEFNTVDLYDLSVPNPRQKVKLLKDKGSSVVIPIFSDRFNENDFPLQYGWKVLTHPIVRLDWNEREVKIDSCLTPTLNEMINYHLEHNLPIDLFLSVMLRENHDLISDGYYVDWKTRTLVFTTVNYTSTYRLIVSVNQLYLNNLLLDMYGKK